MGAQDRSVTPAYVLQSFLVLDELGHFRIEWTWHIKQSIAVDEQKVGLHEDQVLIAELQFVHPGLNVGSRVPNIDYLQGAGEADDLDLGVGLPSEEDDQPSNDQPASREAEDIETW